MEGRYSLLRIILIDCHIRGRVSELKVDSHTNISGTNAAGKTTLQRLLPLFWGELPSNIQRKNSVKDSIPLYYLPRDSSLLIYEYLRGTGQICQVLICSDTKREKLQYRFVDKPYCETDYGTRSDDGKYKPHSVRDIGGNLRRKGIECSELLSNVQDYRAIIQNNRQYLRKNKQSRLNLSNLAYNYSMCEPKESLVHMEKIVTAILSKHGKLDAMRQMVAQIIQENSQAFETPKIDSVALSAMTNDIGMLRAFKTNQTLFDRLISLGVDFNEVIQSICVLKSQALGFRPLLESTINSHKSDIEELRETKANAHRRWEETRSQLSLDKKEAEQQKETVEKRIDSIHSKRTWWADQNLSDLKTDVEILPIKREEKQNTKERLNDLLEEVEADQLKLESQKNIILIKFDKQQKSKQGQLTSNESKLSEEESIHNNNNIQLSSNKHEAINQTKDKHRDEIQTYQTIIGDLSIKAQTSNKTHEEESRLLTVASNHEEAEGFLSELKDELLSLTTQKSDFISDRSEADKKHSRVSRDISELEDKIHELSILAYPPAGSLHEFLEDSIIDWKSDIGRIINPGLLSRTDLAPSVNHTDSPKDFFGITLRTSTIHPPSLLSEREKIISDIEKQEQKLSTLGKNKEDAEKTLKKIHESIGTIERDIKVLESKISNAEKNLQSCKGLLDMANFEVQQAVDDRKQEYIRQQKLQKKELDNLKIKHSTEIEILEEQWRKKKDHELERWQGIQETITENIDSIKTSLFTLSEKKEQHIKDLEKDFNAALSKKGIDDEVIAKLQTTIEKLTEEISATENRKGLIREFEDWQHDIWETELPRKNKEVEQLTESINTLNTSIEITDKNFNAISAEINTKQKTFEGAYRDYSGEMERLNKIQKEWGAFDRIESDSLSFSLSNIRQALNEAESKLSQFDSHYREITNHIDQVSSIINLNGNSAIIGAWSQLLQEAQEQLNNLSNGHTYKRHIYVTERLPQLVYNQVSNIENLQKSQAQRYGDQFKKLHDILIGYHRMIDLESRTLAAVISENLDLDGISNAEIGLKSKIKELGYWETLEDIVKHFDEWKETGFVDLPNEEFLSALSEMKNLLHKITGSIQLDTIFDLFVKIEENGKPLIITNDSLLDNVSSNGMKYLVLCKLYMGFTKMLNESRRSVIHWPVDELGELHGNNISKLFHMLNKNNVIMVGALPQPDTHLLDMFTNKYIIDKSTKQLKTILENENPLIDKLKHLKGKLEITKESNNAT